MPTEVSVSSKSQADMGSTASGFNLEMRDMNSKRPSNDSNFPGFTYKVNSDYYDEYTGSDSLFENHKLTFHGDSRRTIEITFSRDKATAKHTFKLENQVLSIYTCDINKGTLKEPLWKSFTSHTSMGPSDSPSHTSLLKGIQRISVRCRGITAVERRSVDHPLRGIGFVDFYTGESDKVPKYILKGRIPYVKFSVKLTDEEIEGLLKDQKFLATLYEHPNPAASDYTPTVTPVDLDKANDATKEDKIVESEEAPLAPTAEQLAGYVRKWTSTVKVTLNKSSVAGQAAKPVIPVVNLVCYQTDGSREVSLVRMGRSIDFEDDKYSFIGYYYNGYKRSEGATFVKGRVEYLGKYLQGRPNGPGSLYFTLPAKDHLADLGEILDFDGKVVDPTKDDFTPPEKLAMPRKRSSPVVPGEWSGFLKLGLQPYWNKLGQTIHIFNRKFEGVFKDGTLDRGFTFNKDNGFVKTIVRNATDPASKVVYKYEPSSDGKFLALQK